MCCRLIVHAHDMHNCRFECHKEFDVLTNSPGTYRAREVAEGACIHELFKHQPSASPMVDGEKATDIAPLTAALWLLLTLAAMFGFRYSVLTCSLTNFACSCFH